MDAMNLTEYGKQNNLTDEQLVEWAKINLGMSEEDIWLMLAIERGETDGDVIQEDDD
jgi:hypothetical protein